MSLAHYNHQEVEKKWQDVWYTGQDFGAPDRHASPQGVAGGSDLPAKPKAYILDMFPYPSGEGLHVGHPEGYTASDIFSRYLRMNGKDVLHPMGWDAFGLPAENYAIKTGTHPAETTKQNIANFKRQIKALGFSYDWSREVNTTDPEYYKWTQWIFLKLFEHGLAYEAEAPINWCPKDKTGLANEEVVGGKCDRCGTPVEKKNIRQWLVKITDAKYIERLLNDLDTLDWPDSIKQSQRNWIGKSDGAHITFALRGITGQDDDKHSVQVFTTRPDTIFGATFLVISPELAKTWLTIGWEAPAAVTKYITTALAASDIDRQNDTKEKTGVDTGIRAVNPASGEEIPVWVADYVLGGYGTGAIMAVPAHDERDSDFAMKFKLPIIQVIEPIVVHSATKPHPELVANKSVFSGEGKLINSGKYTGMTTLGQYGARHTIVADLENNGKAKFTTNYKLRDWVFSRQRYWGEPIPVVHCPKDGIVGVPEEHLPVVLPDVKKYEPTGTGESPLANIQEWVNTTCPKCGGPATRETNTMPQWAGSNWYFLRYCDPYNSKQLAHPEKLKAWLPVDTYIGGAEHAVLHLLYARFIYKFLRDIGSVPNTLPDEPFTKLINQGLILAEDGQKMSKSRGNVVNPDLVVREYGADSLRMFEMFMGPLNDTKPWNTRGIVGVRRFLDKTWQLQVKVQDGGDMHRETHALVQQITFDIQLFSLNTAISNFMKWVNTAATWETVQRKDFEIFLILLSPFAPHLAQELWSTLGHTDQVHSQQWPAFDATKVMAENVEVVVQINGKVRDKFTIVAGADDDALKAQALASDKIQKWLDGKTPKKVIVVKGKLVSIVV